MDNFCYYLRAVGGEDRFDVEPLVRRWSQTYDLVVRLLPDILLRADGVRSTNDEFRDTVEAILDERLPGFVAPERLVTIPASQVNDAFDWWPIAELLAQRVGEPLLADGVAGPRPKRATKAPEPAKSGSQLPLELD